MRRPITDDDCRRAALARLADHLDTRPMTPAEAALAAAEADASADAIAVEANRKAALELTLRTGPGKWDFGVANDVQKLRMQATALRGIADNPTAAWEETRRALVERVRFYTARVAGAGVDASL